MKYKLFYYRGADLRVVPGFRCYSLEEESLPSSGYDSARRANN